MAAGTVGSHFCFLQIAFLEKSFTIDTGELTPTMKVKRKFIEEQFRERIEQLYAA